MVILLLICSLGVTVGGLSVFIQEAEVSGWIKAAVEEQTGGKLDFEHVDFSITHGLTLSNISFTPPLRSDDTGYRQGGRLESESLLRAKSLKVHYSLPALMLLKISISNLKVESPELYIEQSTLGTNLDGIANYRARHFPTDNKLSQQAEDRQVPFKMSAALPVTPSKLIMPIGIAIDQVGVENLRVQLVKTSENQDQIIFNAGPFDVLAGFHWIGTNSDLRLRVLSQGLAKIQQTGGAPFEIAVKLDNTVSIKNFTELNIDFVNQVQSVAVGSLSLSDINSDIHLRSQFSPVYDQIKVKELKIALFDALVYQLHGDISLPEDNFEVIRLNLKQSMKVDLFALNQTLQHVLPQSNLFGLINLAKLDIQGDITPNRLDLANLTMPYVNGNLQVVDVKADLSELGLAIAPVNGSVSVGAGPNMIGKGSQADVMVDIKLPNVSFKTKSGGKNYQLEVRDLETSMTTRGLFPDAALPIFKLNIEAEHIVAKADGVETVDVPLEINVDLDVREGLSKASASTRIELPFLLEAGFDLDCRSMCKELKLAGDLDIRSLGQLFSIAQPILQRNMSLKNIPAKLAGGVASKFTVRGGIKDLKQVAVESLIEGGNLDLNMYLNINDVSVQLPGYGLSLDGFNNRVFVDGNLEKLKLAFKQDFDSLKIADKKLVKDQITIEKFQFDTALNAEATGPFLLSNPAANMKSKISTSLSINKVIAPGYTPRPINNPMLKVSVLQEGLRRMSVDNININVPDFGAELSGQIEAALDKKMRPQNLASKFKVALNHGVGKALPSGVRSSGNAEFKIAAHSEDMKTFSVAGGILFDHFSLDVPELEDPNKTLLKVQDMHGGIPIQQKIDLLALQNKSGSKISPDYTNANFEQIAEDFFTRNQDLLAERENRIVELDYGSVRPFFPEKTPLTIRQIDFKNLALQKMEIDIELRQNWFAINQFMVQFLGGQIHGGMQFAFNPAPVGLNTTLHLTRLDTRKLIEGFPKLRKKTASVSLFSDPYLDATMHLRYNMHSDEIDGGMDITAIGKEQLRMILYYIDPQQSNPTIAQIRTALNFGEVSQVSVPIKNGFIGMNVGVNVLSAPIPLPELRGFPIAQVIKNFKDQPDAKLSSQVLEEENRQDEDKAGEVELDAEPIAH